MDTAVKTKAETRVGPWQVRKATATDDTARRRWVAIRFVKGETTPSGNRRKQWLRADGSVSDTRVHYVTKADAEDAIGAFNNIAGHLDFIDATPLSATEFVDDLKADASNTLRAA